MELLLHYVWKHRLYDAAPLTTGGEQVDVLDVGQHNTDAGPDFFNAKIRIGNMTWAGNVEIHEKEEDWYAHGHDGDSTYNNTILHVIGERSVNKDFIFPVVTLDHKQVPTVVLRIPANIRENYRSLLEKDEYPRCHEIIPDLSPLKIHSWLSAMLAERLDERAALVSKRAEELGGDWERAFFITLARNFGFGKNGDEFELWAKQLPLQDAVHHRDNMFQIEAMYLGVAGLLENGPVSHQAEAAGDPYRLELLQEYKYLCAKFRRKANVDEMVIPWRFMRMRPQSFPHIRIVQLADLYCKGATSLSAVIDSCDNIKSLEKLLECKVSDYWQTHYTFGCESVCSHKRLTHSSRHLIIINTVVPVLWAYAEHQHRPELKEKAMNLLESIRCEQNYIIRQWRACGVKVDTAADSQALIQLKKTRCDRYDCLRCRFAYDYLKTKH